MEDFWETYFRGDLEVWADYLAPEYKNIGTTREEIWNNADEVLDYTRSILPQLVEQAELRDKEIAVHVADPYVIAHEFGNIYVKAKDQWDFYSEFRVSSFLKKDNGSWKVFHQHGSYPDHRTEQGEALGLDEILAENRKLQAAVDSRTNELEEKYRELQVEAALERVRVRAMAMHNTSELQEVINTVAQQMHLLDIDINGGVFILINEENTEIYQLWGSSGSTDYVKRTSIPFLDKPIYTTLLNAIAARQDFLIEEYTHEEKREFFEHLFSHPPYSQAPEDRKQEILAREGGYTRSMAINEHTSICIVNHHGRKFSDAENQVLRRMGGVLEQTYIRFLDLQKAEEQAREAHIEAALERVRSRTMGMQRSDELPDAANVLFEQMQSLGMPAWSAGYCIWDDDKSGATCWMSSEGVIQPPFHAPLTEDPLFISFREAYERGEELGISEMGGPELVEHYVYMRSLPVVGEILDSIIEAGHPLPTFQINHCAYFSHGFLLFITYEPVPQAYEIFKRFAKVFDQTYTRFLDLRNAEALARESQIETALERVRARTMAMQSGSELGDTASLLFDQLLDLGFKPRCCGFLIADKEAKELNDWSCNVDQYGKGEIVTGILSHDQHPIINDVWNTWVAGKPYYIGSLHDAELQDYYKDVTMQESASEAIRHLVLESRTSEYTNSFYFEYGMMYVLTPEPISEEDIHIMLRFAEVFKGTYRRFLDLETAEALAREARIEASLERVRSRTMAMRESQELSEAATVLFTELNKLTQSDNLWMCGFALCDTEPDSDEFWLSTETGELMKLVIPHTEDAAHKKMYEGWKNGETNITFQIVGEELDEHYRYLKSLPDTRQTFEEMKAAGNILPDFQELHAIYFTHGYLLIVTLEPYADDALLKRFGVVFEQTYTRFLDLQRAEAQAYQAQIETALERVRARALAMQVPEELKDVADVMRKEMGQLGVEELETSSIYILDDSNSTAQCWYAIKDIREEGSKLINDYINIDFSVTHVGREMIRFYNSDDERASILMTGEPRLEWIKYCEEVSDVLGGYYGDEIPDRTYHLFKFSHGSIGAASAGDISEESWDLLQRAASVFSLAYSRFRDLTQARTDLQQLKEEKRRAEDALTDLRAAQMQLVQAEKMASLGELTAGIAHEIKNPLNFVNNFSELSKELLDEMQEEMIAGNSEEVDELVTLITENLQKIAHHGHRADAIVKSMLQHSRASAGTRELTDINALVDEYLRLAYHGLRAKDKSFNADFSTELDVKLPQVEVVAQDIGRVLLNLINNAFYTVSEKRHEMEVTDSAVEGERYQPSVKVTTKLEIDRAIIVVEDNGNGIPDSVVAKIFQPFFTTKPTGEGTGLGLSLSYDIVRTHGGELRVESEEGSGTRMIISLPVKGKSD